jgi:tetratricopeptide (TPR) repeat protein
MGYRGRAAGLCALLLLCVLGSAHAEPTPSPAAEAEAKQLYDQGQALYKLGDWPQAIAKFKAAYVVVHKPFFLFNIAQAYRLSGDFKQALFFYKQFQDEAPDAFNKDEVANQIRALEETLDKQAKTATSPPKGTVPPDSPPHAKIPAPSTVSAPAPARELPEPSSDRPRPIYKKWWFWTGIGVAVAGAAAVVLTTSSGGSVSTPSTPYGNTRIF